MFSHPSHYRLKVKLELKLIHNNIPILIITNTNTNSLPGPNRCCTRHHEHRQRARPTGPEWSHHPSSSHLRTNAPLKKHLVFHARFAPRAAESRRASAASSVDSTKSNKDAKSSKDPRDKKSKLTTVIMATFWFVI
ncbi:hypothetical protein E4U58_003182 [Claviceps cyperi]|nr:hypothetical protein E4U58_003182 [Claviceps cyperi]